MPKRRGNLKTADSAKLTELELCALTELAEQTYGWSPWDLWKSKIGNARVVYNRLYRKGLVRVDEAGYYYSLERENGITIEERKEQRKE